jgi:hypothetical protein
MGRTFPEFSTKGHHLGSRPNDEARESSTGCSSSAGSLSATGDRRNLLKRHQATTSPRADRVPENHLHTVVPDAGIERVQDSHATEGLDDQIVDARRLSTPVGRSDLTLVAEPKDSISVAKSIDGVRSISS